MIQRLFEVTTKLFPFASWTRLSICKIRLAISFRALCKRPCAAIALATLRSSPAAAKTFWAWDSCLDKRVNSESTICRTSAPITIPPNLYYYFKPNRQLALIILTFLEYLYILAPVLDSWLR